mgnify:CR=1 FL=1
MVRPLENIKGQDIDNKIFLNCSDAPSTINGRNQGETGDIWQ